MTKRDFFFFFFFADIHKVSDDIECPEDGLPSLLLLALSADTEKAQCLLFFFLFAGGRLSRAHACTMRLEYSSEHTKELPAKPTTRITYPLGPRLVMAALIATAQ